MLLTGCLVTGNADIYVEYKQKLKSFHQVKLEMKRRWRATSEDRTTKQITKRMIGKAEFSSPHNTCERGCNF